VAVFILSCIIVGGGYMVSSLITRNVRIGKKRTSVRLEKQLWIALDEIVKRENMTLHEICTNIATERGAQGTTGGFTSSLRVYVVKYFRNYLHQIELADLHKSADNTNMSAYMGVG